MPERVAPIVLITDYGLQGPYIGQVLAVFCRQAPDIPVISLFADAPAHNPRASAYLLASYAPSLPPDSIFFCVIDPGVGSWQHKPVIVHMNEQWFVGPDNGLFDVLARRSPDSEAWEITWRPQQLSASFHGRDLYAPTVAKLATGELELEAPEPFAGSTDWPDDLAEVVYIDHYGNAMTGLRAKYLNPAATIAVHGHWLNRAESFSHLLPQQACWYENANGLVELAVNCGRAADHLGVAIGSKVSVHAPAG